MPLSARAHTRTHTALLIVSSIDWTPAILLQILFCTHTKKIHCHRFSWFHGAPFCESFGPPGVLNETPFSFNTNTVNFIERNMFLQENSYRFAFHRSPF